MDIAEALRGAKPLFLSGDVPAQSILILTEQLTTIMTMAEVEKCVTEEPMRNIKMCAAKCQEDECVIASVGEGAFEPFRVKLNHFNKKA